MSKYIFELLISPLTISNNCIINYLLTSLIGFFAYKISFGIVGDIGVRGELGSIIHWMIRFVIFVFLWAVCCLLISLFIFINKHIIISLIIFIIFMLVFYFYNKKNIKQG